MAVARRVANDIAAGDIGGRLSYERNFSNITNAHLNELPYSSPAYLVLQSHTFSTNR